MSESEQKRVYSADEIRRVADRLEASGAAKEIYLMVGNSLANDEYHGRDIVDMLRQAADAEEELANLKTTSGELEKEALEYADHGVSSPLLTNTIKRLIAERNSLKARLKVVVNMLANVNHECRYSNAVSMLKDEYDAILQAACGEEGAE